MELPITKNIKRKRGDDWFFKFRLIDIDNTDPDNPIETPRDMTGAAAELQIRQNQSHTGNIVAEATMVSTPEELLDGWIIMRVRRDGASGHNTLVTPGVYRYDCQILHDDVLETYYEGNWEVTPEVTT